MAGMKNLLMRGGLEEQMNVQRDMVAQVSQRGIVAGGTSVSLTQRSDSLTVEDHADRD